MNKFHGWNVSISSRVAADLLICAAAVMATCSCTDSGTSEDGGKQPSSIGPKTVTEEVHVLRSVGYGSPYFPLTETPLPGMQEGRVPSAVIAQYESRELQPTDAVWYEWPPTLDTTLIVLGFELNALKVEQVANQGKVQWLPLKLPKVQVKSSQSGSNSGALPSGSMTIESIPTKLYASGTITGATADGEILVRVDEKTVLVFEPVLCTWYYGTSERRDTELRIVFGTGNKPWPKGHRDGFETNLLACRNISIEKMVRILPEGRLEPIPK
ncbi:MAG: hypothetical protein H6840_11825 [Planctomycetes bacterium]|nr:hypothetical protein [Planctomycetota bacterium]